MRLTYEGPLVPELEGFVKNIPMQDSDPKCRHNGILWYFMAVYGIWAFLPKSLIRNQIRFFRVYPIFRLFPTFRLSDSTTLVCTGLLWTVLGYTGLYWTVLRSNRLYWGYWGYLVVFGWEKFVLEQWESFFYGYLVVTSFRFLLQSSEFYCPFGFFYNSFSVVSGGNLGCPWPFWSEVNTTDWQVLYIE